MISKIEVEMKDGFKLLESNEDVLGFEDNDKLFKVGKFKEKIKNEITKKFYCLYEDQEINDKKYYLIDYLREIFIDGLEFNYGYINIECVFPKHGVNCQLLALGYKKWQKGKLRIRAFIESSYDENESKEILYVQVCPEFSPDEPEIIEPESPLDDLRRIINEVKS